MRTKTAAIVLLYFGFLSISVFAQEWAMKQGPLMTDYAAKIDPKNVLPEYPRPQMVREKWMNLNGIWGFQPARASDAVPFGTNLNGKILVPFPVESPISGVMKHYDRVWYKRTFVVPKEWRGQRIMLHFGAVDWESEIYVNGRSVGLHRGGYDPFSFDITPYLRHEGPQELIVRVFDPTEDGGQPRGKQAIKGISIMYTPTTGIWQPVWLEPVPQTGIYDLKIVPDVDHSALVLTVNTEGEAGGVTVKVKVKSGTKTVQTGTGVPNKAITIAIPNPKLWSPDAPFLYDLDITLEKKSRTIDSVTSYFGMRKISVGMVDGFPKMLLNNKFIFQLGPLDQGFWPDGLYTAPTDDALKFDLEQEKALGFNMVRKHVKVEPYRWYYWADKLGLLVWQDMPTAQSYGGVDADSGLYSTELTRMVQTHWNSPSIIMWVVYNEKCGEDAIIKQGLTTPMLSQRVKELDPTRLVNQASGYDWYGAGDVADSHTYPAPQAIPGETNQAIVSGEFGAIKYPTPGHRWGEADAVEVTNATEYLKRYTSYAKALCQLKTENGMSGAVYTQITDVETELNGIFTYDRKATKADLGILRDYNLRAINQRLSMKDILPTSRVKTQTWKYTTKTPETNWFNPQFDDQSWTNAEGPFASEGTPGIRQSTVWNSADIWLRQTFGPVSIKAADWEKLVFHVYHDEDCEVYINGVLALSLSGFETYSFVPMTEAGKKALKADGTNEIAVHCHQTEGGQGIDVGIQIMDFE